MKFEPVPVLRARSGRLAPRLVQAIAVSSCSWLSLAQAQQNAVNVSQAVQPARVSYCSSSDGQADVCQVGGLSQAQLAPDKFVMLSKTALAVSKQQFDHVQQRLDTLRGTAAGGAGTRSLAIGAPQPLVAPGVQPPPSALPPSVPPPISAFSSGVPPASQASVAPASGEASSGGAPGSVGSAGAAGAGGGGSVGSIVAPGSPLPDKGLGLFVRVEGARASSDPTSFDPGFTQRATVFTIGADYRVHPDVVLGAAFGSSNSRSTLDTDDAAPSGNVSHRGTSVSLYGSYYPVPNGYVDAIVQFGRGRYNSRRDIPTLNDTAVGETSSSQFGASVGGGYAFAAQQWSYGPYARVSYSKAELDAFVEQRNPTDSNLSVAEQSATSLISTLGAQVSYVVSQSWGVLVPNARLEWNHQFQDDKVQNIVATFAGAGAGALPIDTATTAVDKNYFTFDIGLAAHFGAGRSGVLNYSTVIGRSGQTAQVITAELRLEF